MTMLLVVILLFRPATGFGQADGRPGRMVSEAEIYAIMELVIKKDKPDLKKGLRLTPEDQIDISEEDSVYLQSLLIREPVYDTAGKGGRISVLNFTVPDRNIFSQADIDDMLESRKQYSGFQWDAGRLGFSSHDERAYYAFSVPYFNRAGDKAILTTRFYCPGLCGNGQIYLLEEKGGHWTVSILGMWVH
jgi:hypothetical protein